jgi:serine/threonine protein kinase
MPDDDDGDGAGGRDRDRLGRAMRGAMTRSRAARDRGAPRNDDAPHDVEGHANDDVDDDDAAGERANGARDARGRRTHHGASSPGGSARARPSSVAHTSGNHPAVDKGLTKRRRRDRESGFVDATTTTTTCTTTTSSSVMTSMTFESSQTTFYTTATNAKDRLERARQRHHRVGAGLTRSSSRGAFQGIHEFNKRAADAAAAKATCDAARARAKRAAAEENEVRVLFEDETRASRGAAGRAAAPGATPRMTTPATPVIEDAHNTATTTTTTTTTTTSSDEATVTVTVKMPPSANPTTKTTALGARDDDPSSDAELRRDEPDGHMVYSLGDILADEYTILSVLGEGTFGRVLECWDSVARARCAVKVIRNVQKYRDAAMIEIEVLKTLSGGDPLGGGESFNCITLRRAFEYRGHVCMVFDKCGPSLYDFLRANRYKPFHPSLVQAFCKQLLVSVEYLHSLRLVHTDLKPENVLLMTNSYTGDDTYRVPTNHAIRLIDYGSTTFEDRHHSAVVSTRHYRAPEIILGLGWSYPCDMWSIGCIMVELLTGEALFQTHEDVEHLAMMQHALEARVPLDVARRRSKKMRVDYFNADGLLNWPNETTDDESYAALGKTGIVRSLIDQYLTGEPRRLFADLVRRLLEFDPRRRITSRDAVNHPFFALDLEKICWNVSGVHKSNDRVPKASATVPHV